MPRKKNPSKAYGQKIIQLFAEMLFSNEKSLPILGAFKY